MMVVLTMIILGACSNQNDEVEKETNEEKTTGNVEEEGQGVEVDKGLMNVEITMPKNLVGVETAGFEQELEENRNAEIVKEDDESFTVKLSKNEHSKMLKDFEGEMEATFQDIIDNEETSSVKAIKPNKDYSKITLVVDEASFEKNFNELNILTVGVASMFYQVLDGKDVEKNKATVILEDEATGDNINEIIFPDVLKAMEEELENNE